MRITEEKSDPCKSRTLRHIMFRRLLRCTLWCSPRLRQPYFVLDYVTDRMNTRSRTDITNDICSVGHKMSWNCYNQCPTLCRTCHAEKQREGERKDKGYQRLVVEALARQQHETKMVDRDDRIEISQQRAKDSSDPQPCINSLGSH